MSLSFSLISLPLPSSLFLSLPVQFEKLWGLLGGWLLILLPLLVMGVWWGTKSLPATPEVLLEGELPPFTLSSSISWWWCVMGHQISPSHPWGPPGRWASSIHVTLFHLLVMVCDGAPNLFQPPLRSSWRVSFLHSQYPRDFVCLKNCLILLVYTYETPDIIPHMKKRS